MPRIKIKQLDERIATAGIHMGGGPERRKLEPGEIVEISGDLYDAIWNTGKVELTNDPATRPLDYASYVEARLCSPGFRSRGLDEEDASEKARAEVTARLNAAVIEPVKEDKPPVPISENLPIAPEEKAPPVNRRAARRDKLKANKTSEQTVTA